MIKKSNLIIIIGGLIIIALFLFWQMNDKQEESQNYISRAQAAKMLSLLTSTQEEIDKLDISEALEDVDEEVWYAGYVQASLEADYFQLDKNKFYPMTLLTYEDLLYLKDKFQVADEALSFTIDEKKKDKEVSKPQWIEFYKKITDGNNEIEEKEFIIAGTPSNIQDLTAWHCATDEGTKTFTGLSMDTYIDQKVRVLVKGDEILIVTDAVTDQLMIQNAWIVEGSGQKIEAYVYGYYRTYQMDKALASDVQKVMGDITLNGGQIEKLTVKQNVIKGEILEIGDDYIEIKHYGKVPVQQPFKVYQLYDGFDEITMDQLEAGNRFTEFVVEGDFICGAIIRAEKEADTIRVVISTDNFSGYAHQEVSITSDVAFYAVSGDTRTEYAAGETVTVGSGSQLFNEGQVSFETSTTTGKLKLLNVSRSQGNPEYRGSIILKHKDGAIHIINELLVEEYLYAVLPSEMPVSYGLEALKVQAVCARSFAIKSLEEDNFSQYDANVDDSVNSQVYNNSGEHDMAIRAVDDTYGEVLTYGQDLVKAYFFSTSSGYTADVADVWISSSGTTTEYLKGKQQLEEGASQDMSDEATFKAFIDDYDNDDYFEKEIAWFRWETQISTSTIRTALENVIIDRCAAAPDYIQVKNADGQYEAAAINGVGQVQKIEITERGTSGVVRELIVTGSDRTVKIIGEYNIRLILAPLENQLVCIDGTVKTGVSMLPSGFFYLTDNNNGTYTLKGGGYGHGVGMSQNGVKAMTDLGYSYEDILKHYYTGTNISLNY